jgi:hypothetical protein
VMNNDDGPMPAGTMYLPWQEQLLLGLPSRASIESAHTNRWLLKDGTNYRAQGLYAGRQAGLCSAVCHPRRFAPTLVPVEAAEDEGDAVPENIIVSARLYDGRLN